MATTIKLKRKKSTGNTGMVLHTGEPYYNTIDKHLYVGNTEDEQVDSKKHIAEVTVTNSSNSKLEFYIGEDENNKVSFYTHELGDAMIDGVHFGDYNNKSVVVHLAEVDSVSEYPLDEGSINILKLRLVIPGTGTNLNFGGRTTGSRISVIIPNTNNFKEPNSKTVTHLQINGIETTPIYSVHAAPETGTYPDMYHTPGSEITLSPGCIYTFIYYDNYYYLEYTNDNNIFWRTYTE